MDHIPDAELIASARRHDVESKIFDGTATKVEARDWYFSLDPLRDDYYSSLIESSTGSTESDLVLHNIEYSLSQIALYGTAAQILSVDKIEHFEGYVPINTFNHGIQSQKDTVPKFKYVEYNNFSLSKLRDIDSIHELNIAQDCYSRASRYCMDVLRVLDGNEEEKSFTDSLYELQGHYDRKSIDANKTVTSLANGWILSGADELMPETDVFDSIIDAQMQWLGNQFYHLGITKDFSYLKSAFTNTVETIEDFIINPTLKSGRKTVKNPVLKGYLHEMLWLLDANFALSKEYDDIGPSIVPAPIGFDRPEINHPELKRGYDMIFVGINARIPIQLKSGSYSASKSKYDERIYIAQESNFQDIDLRRLSSRLNDYKKWIESDFNDDFMVAKISSRILKTVPDALDAFEKYEAKSHIDETVIKLLGNQSIQYLSNTHPIYKPKK